MSKAQILSIKDVDDQGSAVVVKAAVAYRTESGASRVRTVEFWLDYDEPDPGVGIVGGWYTPRGAYVDGDVGQQWVKLDRCSADLLEAQVPEPDEYAGPDWDERW